MTSTAPVCAEQAHRKRGVPTGLALKSKAHLTWVRSFQSSQTLPQFSVLLTGRHDFKWRVFSLPVCGPNIFKLCVKISLKNYKTIHWLAAAKSSCGETPLAERQVAEALDNHGEHVPPLRGHSCQMGQLSLISVQCTQYTASYLQYKSFAKQNYSSMNWINSH